MPGLPALAVVGAWLLVTGLWSGPPLARGQPASPSSSGNQDPSGVLMVEEGVIAGAHYAVAIPAGPWNHRLLLLAHGFRLDAAPLLPDLHPERLSNQTLLKEGWMVASTSYRRNGMILADAVADLDALRAHIAVEHGALDRVIVEGESTGGTIAARIAERDTGLYAGAVALCATLYVKEPGDTSGLSLVPHIPLLFLTNRSELPGTKAYVSVNLPTTEGLVHPQLWVIGRDGHVNINQSERLAALRAINAWIDSGRESLPAPAEGAAFFDATIPPQPGPSSVIPLAGGHGFRTRVLEVSPIDGQMTLDAQARDFAAAGIEPMTYFQLRLGGNSSFRVLYGRDYANVRRNQWLAIPDAEGRTALAKIAENAATDAGVEAGDSLTVARYGGP